MFHFVFDTQYVCTIVLVFHTFIHFYMNILIIYLPKTSIVNCLPRNNVSLARGQLSLFNRPQPLEEESVCRNRLNPKCLSNHIWSLQNFRFVLVRAVKFL